MVTRIYVELLDEGTFVMRPVEARRIGGNLFEILRPVDYDPDDEVWKFKPGEIVECVRDDSRGTRRVVAVRVAEVESRHGKREYQND